MASFFTMPIGQIKEVYQFKLQGWDEDRHVTSETKKGIYYI